MPAPGMNRMMGVYDDICDATRQGCLLMYLSVRVPNGPYPSTLCSRVIVESLGVDCDS